MTTAYSAEYEIEVEYAANGNLCVLVPEPFKAGDMVQVKIRREATPNCCPNCGDKINLVQNNENEYQVTHMSPYPTKYHRDAVVPFCHVGNVKIKAASSYDAMLIWNSITRE